MHRESPAISLGSLHLACLLQTTLCVISLLFINRRCKSLKVISFCIAILLIGTFAGFIAMPLVRDSFSRGTGISYIFASMSVAILIGCFSMIYYLDKNGFWLAPSPGQTTETKEPSNEETQEILKEKYESIFKTRGLTRQQATIAALLALKTPDANICAILCISPNTLKTHIHKILQKLQIASRHELAWIVLKH